MNPLLARYGAEKRWVSWKLQTRDAKTTKLPYQLNGKLASSTDPKTWSTYKEITDTFDNVGIVLTDGLLLAIDIDHVVEKGRIVHPQREVLIEFLTKINSYTEISPSGTGLHVFLELSDPLTLVSNKKAPVEAYVTGRYLTFTGMVFGKSRPLRTVTAEEAYRILETMIPQKKKWDDSSHEVKQPSAPVSLLDAPPAVVILEKMFAASNGEAIEKLYNGDITSHGNDYSRADMALLSHLAFWAGKDAARMEEMWLASPLGQREKTKTRADYRGRSIKSAIDRCTEVYNPELRGTSEVSIDDLNLLYQLKGKQKVYYKNTENITRVIQNHSDFKATLRYDAYRNIVERKVNGTWRKLEDRDAIDIQTKISVLFSDFAHISKQMVEDAFVKVAYDNAIDSGRDYVESLTWDGTARLDSWLSLAFGTPQDEYHKTVGANWMKGLVKRIVHPGCKFDYVLVLEGKQGIKKSTSLGALAGILGHAETTISTEQKDFFMLMQGNAIVEFSEGETLSRTEVKQLKAVISTQVDKFRPPYGRAVTDHPRRCVFAMTTNQTEYLKDETGNRRWLPVAVQGRANIEWIAENREQLIAEAYKRVIVDGETVYEFPDDALEEQQIMRRIKDPNIDVIVNWYWSLATSRRKDGISVADVYINALHNGFMTKPISRNDEMSISDVLRTWLRLDPQRIRINGIRGYYYFPTEKSELLKPEEVPVPMTAF